MGRSASTLPTVREVLRLALPFGSQVLAGTLGIERPVRHARVGGVLSPIFAELDSEELALLDLRRVQASTPGLTGARVVRELNRLGIAALGVVGTVDRPAQREAERANLPLLHLPDGSDLAQVARAIQRLIGDSEAQIAVQGGALYRHLVEGVMAGQGLGWMVTRLHELTGHIVQLADAEGLLLAEAGARPHAATTQRHDRPLHAGGQTVGQLTFHGPDAEFDSFSLLALEQGAAALALEVVKQEAVQAARAGLGQGLAAALLAAADEATLRTLARAEGFPLERLHWAVLATTTLEGASRVSGEDMAQWAQRAADHAASLGWAVTSHLNTPGEGCQAIWVLAGEQSWGVGHLAFLEHLRETWRHGSSVTIAAGDPAQGVRGLQRTVAQARGALALGQRLFGGGQTHLHRDLGAYRVLRHAQGTDDVAAFVTSMLGALRDYDAAHSSDLLATLETLLMHGGNISATAKALHLHRNSLAYRVERIRALSGLDPTTPDDAFTFRLALLLSPLV